MKIKLLVCFAGVFVSYLLNGIAIEIITTAFGDKIFTFYLFMVFIPSLFNAAFAKIVLMIKPYFHHDSVEELATCQLKESAEDVPKKMYLACAICYIFSLLCSNASLAHINYPTQLVLKSSKPIPILFCAYTFTSKSYPLQRFISTWVIVIGVVSFMYEQYTLKRQFSSTTVSTIKFVGSDYTKGWALVFTSLVFDGMLAVAQERMKRTHKLDTHLLMYYINGYSSIFLGSAVIVFNELPGFYLFMQKHPTVPLYLLLLGLTSACGQNFIYYTITTFGPLTCSVVTTTRKFFNVLLSVVMFGHIFSMKLWLSVIVVFVGLILDIWIPHSSIT